MIQPKSWNEFRNTGLFLIINQILHAFGWVLVFDIEGEEIKGVFPARTKYRGFEEDAQSEQYAKIAKYLNDNSAEILKDIEE